MADWSLGNPKSAGIGQTIYADPSTYQIGGRSLSSILSGDDYKSLTDALTASHDLRSSVQQQASQITQQGLDRAHEYGNIKTLPDYQKLAGYDTTAQGILNKAFQTDRFTDGSKQSSAYNDLYGADLAGTPTASHGFLNKVGGALTKIVPAASLAAAAAITGGGLGLFGGASAGAAGATTAGSTAAGSTAAGTTAAGTAASGGIGSTLSSGLSYIGGIPGSVSSYLGGGTLGAVGSGAVTGGALGGVKSAITGGNILKGTLQGAALGGVTGGVGSLGSQALNGLGITGEGSLLGTTNGTPLSGGVQGPTTGSGFLGGATGGTGSATGSLLSKGLNFMSGGGASSYGSGIGTLLGGVNSYMANQKAQKDLLNAQNNALAQIAPYQQSGGAANSKLSDLLGTSGNSGAAGYGSLLDSFNPADLASDPGYQFNLDQGNKALDRQQAAKGGYFSGAALKAAQDYGQGLADNTYNQAYNRDAATKAQQYQQLAGQAGAGANAANEAAGVYQNIGNTKASAGVGASNIFNQTLSSLLGGGNNNNALLQAILNR